MLLSLVDRNRTAQGAGLGCLSHHGRSHRGDLVAFREKLSGSQKGLFQINLVAGRPTVGSNAASRAGAQLDRLYRACSFKMLLWDAGYSPRPQRPRTLRFSTTPVLSLALLIGPLLQSLACRQFGKSLKILREYDDDLVHA